MSDNLFNDERYFDADNDPIPYRRKPRDDRPTLPDADSDDEPVHSGEYLAYRTVASPPPRLRMIDQSGMVSQPRYFLMDDQMALVHNSDWLALIFSQYVIVLYGRNLDILLSPLQEEKIRWIQCFDPERHYLPTDKTQPIVYRMQRYSQQQFQEMWQKLDAEYEDDEEQ